MKILFWIFGLVCFASCSKKIIPGTYLMSAREKIIVYNDNTYKYFNNGVGHIGYSSGRVVQNGNIITFDADSAGYFKLNVSNYFYDSSLKNSRRIILNNKERKLDDYNFTLYGTGISNVKFNSEYAATYTPISPGLYSGSIQLHAKNKKAKFITPQFYSDTIFSTVLEIENVHKIDPVYRRWNVLVLDIVINEDMFKFQTLSEYIYKNKKLILRDWPIFRLDQKK